MPDEDTELMPGVPGGRVDPFVEPQPVEDVDRPATFTLMAPGWRPPEHLVTQALGFCFTADRQLVLVDLGDRFWSLPGGHVEPGERPADTLGREIAEEARARVIRSRYLACQHVWDPHAPTGPTSYYQTRWWARVELEPWHPNDETVARRLVPPDQFLATLSWQRKQIAARLLDQALAVERADTQAAAMLGPAARDGERFEVTASGGQWVVAWHPPPAAPEGTPHGANAFCVTADDGIVLISGDGERWGWPGGRPEDGESWEQTLRRELAEEICAGVVGARLLGFCRSICRSGVASLGEHTARNGGGLRRSIPILVTADVTRALAHYRALGFETEAWEGGGYGFASRDGVELHLGEVAALDPAANTVSCYLHVADADALHAEWAAAAVGGRLNPPVDTDYGLREGSHVDPDGNLVRFGSPANDAEGTEDP